MITVAEAQAEIGRRVSLLPTEAIPASEARQRILRETIFCPEDMPPFDRSAMDGYALRRGDEAEWWTVRGEIRAGQAIDAETRPGEAWRIFTGARLPGPGLKVVMQENVEEKAGRIRLITPTQDRHVRFQGEDAKAGEPLLESGAVLNPAALGLLASLGKSEVSVTRKPRAFHLTTGDEIVSVDAPLGPGQIRNSNAALIGALVREWGGEVSHAHAPDDGQAMFAQLESAAAKNCDLILISGGSGGGKYDFTAQVCDRLGATIHFRQVDVRPGKPLLFGACGRAVIFGLPGNALSHFVCFHLFVRRALAKMLGIEASEESASLAEEMSDTFNPRETWWPVRAEIRSGRREVSALAWKSSGDITRLPAAQGLIRVPARTERLPAGSTLRYLSLTT
jgi:molybdopterin molybdotransferase